MTKHRNAVESTEDFKLRIRQLVTGNRPFYKNCIQPPFCNCTPPKTMEWSEEDKCWICDKCEATAH